MTRAELRAKIANLAESSADMAIDQSGRGRVFETLQEAVDSYLNNLEDTLRQWGVTAVRDFSFARACFEDALIERGCQKQWVKS